MKKPIAIWLSLVLNLTLFGQNEQQTHLTPTNGQEASFYWGFDFGLEAPNTNLNFGGALGALKYGKIKLSGTASFVNTFGSRIEYQKDLFLKHSLFSNFGGYFYSSVAFETKFPSSYSTFDGLDRTVIAISSHNYLKPEIGFETVLIDQKNQAGVNIGLMWNVLLNDVSVSHKTGTENEQLEKQLLDTIRTPLSFQFSFFWLMRPKRYVPLSN